MKPRKGPFVLRRPGEPVAFEKCADSAAFLNDPSDRIRHGGFVPAGDAMTRGIVAFGGSEAMDARSDINSGSEHRSSLDTAEPLHVGIRFAFSLVFRMPS